MTEQQELWDKERVDEIEKNRRRDNASAEI